MKLTEKELAQAIGSESIAKQVLSRVRKLKRIKNANRREFKVYPLSAYKRYVRSTPSVHRRFEKWIAEEETRRTTDTTAATDE